MAKDDVYQRRDAILAEIHTEVKNLKEMFKETSERNELSLKEHKIDDEKSFAEVNKKLGWGIKIAVVVLVIVAANGGMEAIKVLFKVGG